MADMSPADMMALSGNKDSFLEGNGLIILILFLLIFGWGGGGFGGNNAATQGALTRAELSDGFNTANLQNGIGNLQKGQCDISSNIFGNRYDNAIGMANIEKSVMQNRYDTLIGQNGLAAQIAQNRYDAALQAQTAQAQMASCCCDLRSAVHNEGEMTRALIQQQTIDDLKQQLNTATNAIANAEQSRNLIAQMQGMMSSMGRWVANPAVGQNACCGCGCA